jgi:hypothetical protein
MSDWGSVVIAGTIIAALAFVQLGFYIGRQAIFGDPKFAAIRQSALSIAALSGTNFWGADLSGANFTQATLKNANFTQADLNNVRWVRAKKRDLAYNLKSLLTEEQKTDLAEKINQDKLAKAERKRLEDKESELWHGKNNLEVERDKIHAMKIAIFTSVPQIETLDKNLSKRLKEISDWSTPRNDDLLGDHKKSIANNVKNICHEYHTNNKEQVAALENANKALQSEIDKFKEVESIMPLGYALMVTGILFMFLGNIGAIIFGTIFIVIFIWIARRETDRNDQVKSLAKSIAENTTKGEEIQAKVKIIDGLIGSISK